MTSPAERLQRLAVIHGTGRPPPADLAMECAQWLASAAGPILAGEPVADALGLKGQRGAWQNAPLHRARRDRRDAILRELWNLTAHEIDGDRARQILDWVDSWSALNCEALTGRQARLLLADVPERAKPHLDELLDTRLKVPETRQLLRVIRGASHGTADAAECGSIDSKAPHLAATSDRT